MKDPNSHGLTGMVVVLIGGFALSLGIASLVFAHEPLQPQPRITQAHVQNAPVHIQANAHFAELRGLFSAQALNRALPSTRAKPVLRFADASLQRSVAIADNGEVWYSSLYNGNQQDTLVERLVRQTPHTLASCIVQIPTLKNDVTSIAAGSSGVWFSASAADLVGHVFDDGTVVEYPTRVKGAIPDSPVLGPDGSVWFAEAGIAKIGRLDYRTGDIVEYPTRGSLDSVGKIALSGDREVWFTEPRSEKIGRLNWVSGALTEIHLPVNGSATDITVDSEGDVWFIDDNHRAIGRVNSRLQAIEEFPQLEEFKPKCLGVAADGSAWFCTDAGLGHLDPASHKTTITKLAKNFSPRQILFADGEIWFVTRGGIGRTRDGTAVMRYIPDYQIQYTGKPTQADVNAFIEKHPNFRGGYYSETVGGKEVVQVDWDVSGDLAFSGLTRSNNGTLWLMTDDGYLARFSPPTRMVFKFVGLAPESSAYSIVSDRHGRMWVAEQNRLIRFTIAGTVDRIVYHSPPGIPNDIAVAKDGSLWLALPGLAAHIQPDGETRSYSLPGGGPFGIAQSPDGNLWFTERFAIGRLRPASGDIKQYTLLDLAAPVAIVSRRTGEVWFSDANGRIGRITQGGHIEEFSVPTRNAIPFALAAAPDGNIWFTEFYGARLGELDGQSLKIREFPVEWGNSFPTALAVDSSGTVWFADGNGSFGRFSLSRGFQQSVVPTPEPRGG